MRENFRLAYFDLINQTLDLSQNLYLNDCRQVALLAYLHPIFNESQKQTLKNWVNLLENLIINQSVSPKSPLSAGTRFIRDLIFVVKFFFIKSFL